VAVVRRGADLGDQVHQVLRVGPGVILVAAVWLGAVRRSTPSPSGSWPSAMRRAIATGLDHRLGPLL